MNYYTGIMKPMKAAYYTGSLVANKACKYNISYENAPYGYQTPTGQAVVIDNLAHLDIVHMLR